MYCAECGAPIGSGQRFCSRCGRPAAEPVAPGPPAQSALPLQAAPGPAGLPTPRPGYTQPSRLLPHLNVLGILWIIFSAFRLIPGLVLMIFGHMNFPFALLPIPAPLRMFLGPFVGAIGLLMAGVGTAGVLAGWGLMARRPWARVLAIVLACLSLLHVPLGTALGIYTLWVLVPAGADQEYRTLAGAD